MADIPIEEQIRCAQSMIMDLRDKLCKRITELPDNPRIKRGEDVLTTFFTIKSSDLGSDINLDPTYHDFKRQHKLIVVYLMTGDAAKCVDRLRRVISGHEWQPVKGPPMLINKGTVPFGSKHIKLHPDVIGHLKTILEEVEYKP